MAQSVKHLTFDLSSGHGLMVQEFEPRIWLRTDSVWNSLSASLCPSLLMFSPSLSLSLSLSKINEL